MGIYVELTPARAMVVDSFQDTTIKKIRTGALVICVEHLVLSILRFIVHFSSFYYVEPRPSGAPPGSLAGSQTGSQRLSVRGSF